MRLLSLSNVLLTCPKGQASVAREKILAIVQSWGQAFKSDPMMDAIVNLYQSLLIQGVEFPAQNMDEMSPIVTPAMSIEPSRSVSAAPQRSSVGTGSVVSTDEAYAQQLVCVAKQNKQRA